MLLLGIAPSFTATIQFEQAGWSNGAGPLRGAFSGTDTDGDGSFAASELASFNALWRGPDGTSSGWSLPDIEPDGFLFANIGNYLLFVRNTLYSLVDSAFKGDNAGYGIRFVPLSGREHDNNRDRRPGARHVGSGCCRNHGSVRRTLQSVDKTVSSHPVREQCV